MKKQTISQKYITISGILVLVERKRIKTLRLGVRPPEGQVHISAPVKISDETIISFVQEKMSWIVKQQEKIARMQQTVATQDDREELRQLIEIILPKWEQVTNLRCTSWQIRDMKTRWGSCNTQTGKIWLSLQLAKQPIEFIEYVVLHELVHLRIPGHGKDFKNELDVYMPDWRQKRKL